MGQFRIEHEGRTYKVEAENAQQAYEAVFGAMDPDTAEEARTGAADPAPGGSGQSVASGGFDAVANGLTAGLWPKVQGVDAAIFGRTPEGGWFDYSKPFGERYSRARDAEAAQNEQFREEQPVVAIGGEIAGAIGTGAGLARGGLSLAGRAAGMTGAKGAAARTVGAAGDAAAYGGAYAHNTGGDPVEGALLAAPFGAAGQAVGEGISKAVGRHLGSGRVRAAAKTAGDIKEETDVAYKIFSDEDVALSPAATKRIAESYKAKMKDAALSRHMGSEAYRFYDEIVGAADEGEAVSTKWLENARRRAAAVARTKTKDGLSEHAAGLAVKAIDENLDLMSEADVVAGGSIEKAMRAVKEARGSHRLRLKAQAIEDVMDYAGKYASGQENGIRLGLRRIIGRAQRDQSFRNLWTKEEMDAIEAAANGSNTAAFMRQLGKFGLAGARGGSNMLGAGMGFSGGAGLGSTIGGIAAGPVGSAVGGAIGGLGTLAAGGLGRRISDAATKRDFNTLRALVAGVDNVSIAPEGPVERFLRLYGLGAAGRGVGASGAAQGGRQ
jgi:hypothetical protein